MVRVFCIKYQYTCHFIAILHRKINDVVLSYFCMYKPNLVKMFLVVQLFDAVTTYIAIKYLGQQELNLIFRYLFQELGIEISLLIKLSIAAGFCWIYWRSKQWRVAMQTGLITSSYITSIVGLSNLSIILVVSQRLALISP